MLVHFDVVFLEACAALKFPLTVAAAALYLSIAAWSATQFTISSSSAACVQFEMFFMGLLCLCLLYDMMESL